MFGSPDGYIFETTLEDGHPVTAIRSGPMMATLMRGMRRAVAAMAGAGANLIVDDVFWGQELADYRALLAPFDFHAVALAAPLDVIEAREKARGDRTLGLARWQYSRVHEFGDYDLRVDTSLATPEGCARLIAETFGL